MFWFGSPETEAEGEGEADGVGSGVPEGTASSEVSVEEAETAPVFSSFLIIEPSDARIS